MAGIALEGKVDHISVMVLIGGLVYPGVERVASFLLTGAELMKDMKWSDGVCAVAHL